MLAACHTGRVHYISRCRVSFFNNRNIFSVVIFVKQNMTNGSHSSVSNSFCRVGREACHKGMWWRGVWLGICDFIWRRHSKSCVPCTCRWLSETGGWLCETHARGELWHWSPEYSSSCAESCFWSKDSCHWSMKSTCSVSWYGRDNTTSNFWSSETTSTSLRADANGSWRMKSAANIFSSYNTETFCWISKSRRTEVCSWLSTGLAWGRFSP